MNMGTRSNANRRLLTHIGEGRQGFTSTSVWLDWNAIVHFVNPHDLVVSAVSTELIVFTHDERFDWLGRAYFRTQPTE